MNQMMKRMKWNSPLRSSTLSLPGENMTTCSGSGKIALWQGLMYHVNYYSFRVGKFYEDPNEANVAEAEEIRRFLADPRSRRRVHYR